MRVRACISMCVHVCLQDCLFVCFGVFMCLPLRYYRESFSLALTRKLCRGLSLYFLSLFLVRACSESLSEFDTSWMERCACTRLFDGGYKGWVYIFGVCMRVTCVYVCVFCSTHSPGKKTPGSQDLSEKRERQGVKETQTERLRQRHRDTET